MNLAIIIIISLFISTIWIYYLKLIDIFENEKWGYILFTFIAGTIIPNIIFLIHDYVYDPLGIRREADPLGGFLYYTLGVGLLEETIKVIPVVMVLKFFRKAINEPLDYIKYACVSALGFAFGENVEYAWAYGGDVLIGRSILSVPAHLFFSAIFIYGYILHKYTLRPRQMILRFVAISIMSHGLYDYLLYIDLGFISSLLNVVFFMLLVSSFATIINNGLNNSPFYSPNKTVNQDRLRRAMSGLYLIAMLAVIIYDFSVLGLSRSFFNLAEIALFYSVILSIIIVRLSRFSIIPQVWQEVKFEFPFYYGKSDSRNDFTILFGMFTIKGESYNDSHISLLFNEEIRVMPLNLTRSYLSRNRQGIIEQKLFLNNKPVYVLKIYLDADKTQHKHFLLLAKTKGMTHSKNNDPIVSLNSLSAGDKKELIFHEWVVLKKKK